MKSSNCQIIKVSHATARKPEWSMAEPVDFTLEEGEHIAIVGRNGAGKSMFVDIITGRHPAFPNMVTYGFDAPYDNIKYISFRDTYGGDNDRTYFLQQRWNQMEIDEETPTVASKLEEAYQLAGTDTPERRALQQHIYKLFHLESLLDKYIILLSSGELRKYKLASSLFTDPRVLIMDNPFIGLDAETRDQLKELLATLSEERHLQIILVLSRYDEIPDFITHVVEVRDMHVLPKVSRESFYNNQYPITNNRYTINNNQYPITVKLPEGQNPEGEKTVNGYWLLVNGTPLPVIEFKDVSIRYGSRTILKDLTWTVNQGERWALSGQNGSGKSTLLSLVCADNPQRYACDITLFGHKRGSGNSIWDIKKHIGYVSPEMHRSYRQDIPAIRIVASGLQDTIGLYAKPNEAEYDICRQWMDVFGIGHLADRTFLKMSSGEQRLVLLARAFVKDPDLLILDEPLHGLDNYNRRLVNDVIETFCQRPDKTLIFVTHYQEELPAVIDHAITLQRH